MKKSLMFLAGVMAALALTSFRAGFGPGIREEYRAVPLTIVQERILKELGDAKLLPPGSEELGTLALIDDSVSENYRNSVVGWLGTMSEEGWSLVQFDYGHEWFLFRRLAR